MRKGNTVCDNCGTDFYKRPAQKKTSEHHYCCWACYCVGKTKPDRSCAFCGEGFHPGRNTQRFCSRRCAAKGTRGPWSTKKNGAYKSRSEYRMARLKAVCTVDSCMVEGCDYNKTYDIHRLIPGKDGGAYVVGNMFAICPNHHAEITRGVSRAKKLSDCVIRIVPWSDDGKG